MPFLELPRETHALAAAHAGRRRHIAEGLIGVFSRSFPDITYELRWDQDLINAQAWRLGTDRRVWVYGGLARHPRLHMAGLALTIAHETGHHLGGHPRDPDMPWMTWQGQADYWAASVGMQTAFASRAKALTLSGARQILRVQTEIARIESDEVDLCPQCRHSIFLAGASGRPFPTCASSALEKIRRDSELE